MDTGSMSRRQLLVTSGVGVLAAGSASTVFAAHAVLGAEAVDEAPTMWPGFPRLDLNAVRDLVGACHRNLEQSTAMVKSQPALARCAWDWGFGDWETALGAAAHTGRREIAEMLLEHGARIDVFAAAMLGYTDVVKALVTARPGLQRTWGPHGLTLAHHARAGGERAKETLDYLMSLGDADTPPAKQALADDAAKVYAGRYRFGPDSPEVFEVTLGKQGVELKPGESSVLRLTFVGDHAFYPSGVPTTLIRFEVSGGKAAALSVVMGAVTVSAKRE